VRATLFTFWLRFVAHGDDDSRTHICFVREAQAYFGDPRLFSQERSMTGKRDAAPTSGMAVYLNASPCRLMAGGAKDLDGCLLGCESGRQTCGHDHWRPNTRGDLVLGIDPPKIPVAKFSDTFGHLSHPNNIRTDTNSRTRAH